MALSDINTEIRIIQLASRGEEVRDAIVDALRKIDASATVTVDSELSDSSENPLQNKAIYEALQGKQEALTIDTDPVSESGNPVSSGGVYEALAGKQDGIRLAALHLTDSWSGSGPFTQTVFLDGITENSKVDIQPDTATFTTLLLDGVTALWIQNDNGTLTAFALGAAPTDELTIQCTVTEV